MNYITETQYDQLCDACDALLQKDTLSTERKANTWLHIIREHPIFLQSYTAIFAKGTPSFLLFLFLKLLKYSLIGGLKIFHCLYRNIIKREQLSKLISSYDYIFISHLLNKDFQEREFDFYFHALPQKLQHQEGKALMVYINYIGEVNHSLAKKWKNHEVDKIVLPRYLSVREELKIRVLLFKDAFRLLFEKSNTKISRRIKLQAAVEAFSPASHFNLRMGFQIEQIVQEVQAKQLYTTFEGHPWERIAFAFARKSNVSIKCIGYQHALIFRKQHAIKRRLGQRFDPDFILCSGEDGQAKLEKADLIPASKLLRFGTNRTTLASEKVSSRINLKRNTVLMLAEGDLIEVLPFLDFFYKLAQQNKSLQFIVRFHPMTSVKKVLKLRKHLNHLPLNMIFSNKTFEEDLARSDFAIYRGSTTIIKAVQYGLVPIYIKRPNEMSIDILDHFASLRYAISSPEEFEEIILNSPDIFDQKLDRLIQKVNQFFSPLNYDEALKINKTV